MREWQSWFLQNDDAGRAVPDPTDSYYITAFLTSGMPMHEAPCAQAWSVDGRRLVAMFDQHVHPYSLGLVCADMGRAHVTALGWPTVDPLSRGGYVDQFLEGLEHGKFRGAVASDARISRPDAQQEMGHKDQRDTMDNVLAALQRAITEGTCDIQSEEVIASMMRASVDDKGELQVGPGRRVGHVVCAGRALHALNMLGPSRRMRKRWERNPVIKARDEARRRARYGPAMEPAPREDWG